MGVRRFVSGALVASLALGMLAVTATSASALTSAEQAFVNKINAERGKRGLQKLVVKYDLTQLARSHSAKMANKGSIWHSNPLCEGISGWQICGENVGMGPSVDSLHNAFMNSPSHRDNILYGKYNQIGVGNVVDSDGTIFTTHVFTKRGSTSTTTTTTTTNTTTTKKRRTTTVTKTSTGGSSAPAPKPAAAPAPEKPAPQPKPKPKPIEVAPRTVDVLVRMVGLDADDVDPATGVAAGF